MTRLTAAIPIKPFDRAKKRLSSVLRPAERRDLGERLALRTIDVVSRAGVDVLVLSADDDVTAWARANGVEVLLDEGSSLDRAATVAREHLLGMGHAWLIVHADLPLLSETEVAGAAQQILDGASVIAPSSDGGTSMLGSRHPVPFSYGPGSFHRHLAAIADKRPRVIISTGWALDLDTPGDLAAARRHPRGAWLTR